MPTPRSNITTLRLPSIDSTSLLARRMLSASGLPASPLAIIAQSQTGGVGRLGRAWSSPIGGLWMTVVWPVSSTKTLPDALGLRVGHAVLNAVDAILGPASNERVRFKLPNDLLMDGRKVAGILIEVVPVGADRAVLIGVGVNANVSLSQLPTELHATSTTIQTARGHSINLEALESDLLDKLAAALSDPPPLADIIATLTPRLANLGIEALVTLPDSSRVRGRLVGISPAGLARYAIGSGEVEIASINNA